MLEELVALLRGRALVALTGAGVSTESGIPDYRGPGRPPRGPSIQHRAFVANADVRRRYWARAFTGWTRFAAARPNPAHTALATLERAGILRGLITQNVDGLHTDAGSSNVVELHGNLRTVVCLACDARIRRAALQETLAELNPDVAPATHHAAPDGDADLRDGAVREFVVAACRECGGPLKPDVVFFGGTVDADVVAHSRQLVAQGEVLLVVGSSLTVFSGFRFVREAAAAGQPIAIVNRGETRGDSLATITVDGNAAVVVPAIAEQLCNAP